MVYYIDGFYMLNQTCISGITPHRHDVQFFSHVVEIPFAIILLRTSMSIFIGGKAIGL